MRGTLNPLLNTPYGPYSTHSESPRYFISPPSLPQPSIRSRSLGRLSLSKALSSLTSTQSTTSAARAILVKWYTEASNIVRSRCSPLHEPLRRTLPRSGPVLGCALVW
jgi:hypothetical protein